MGSNPLVSLGWEGQAPSAGSQHVALEVFNVGGWLTHGDLALEAGVDFLLLLSIG